VEGEKIGTFSGERARARRSRGIGGWVGTVKAYGSRCGYAPDGRVREVNIFRRRHSRGFAKRVYRISRPAASTAWEEASSRQRHDG